ncbi:PREDICTED: interleukin-20 receptor subunit alpha-like [Chaetura pelagica]|uniref:interleukin-20 receptor subunit alpha-like n=1 Tax=Chaetura pelagica TaxID=8897 RepID=UPI00052388BA|nr:PREDICTED: interleukin-20 receptor subunit alpha-like [Chaetura pelagica]
MAVTFIYKSNCMLHVQEDEYYRELYCSLPNPRNVHFESRNMKNILHWSAPEGTGDGVLYRVKYSV